MNEVKETNSEPENEPNHLTENLKSVGQMIVGGIEMVGGIITADGITRKEGDFNVEVGSQHQEVNKNLAAADEADEAGQTANESDRHSGAVEK